MPLPDFPKIGGGIGKLRCYVVDRGEVQDMNRVLSDD
jgi:hypothetical protein